ncbi:MAG: hypothetical protein C0601_06750 [Candidatus Muiribacterium halophilum]|uniref:Glycosyltransferase family 28 N-terminal domain-containing protein n=1 Tax=Muiribacterium halophilum TaxID=2053465 RepID=A0A2N5ZGH2_MUIH1|nr:MAG: hypothetical protein C0601_06750 [Candidatus Muirbacterium halophilum]
MSLTLETENIVVTGGGTGGHTFASVKFLELFKKWYPNKSLIYIGSGNDFEKDIFKNIKDVQLKYISTGKFRRALDKRNISDFFSFFSGIFQSYRFLKKRKVSYILSTGGYVSLGPVIAARMLSIPIIVHEQTSIPGIANRLAFRLSDINLYSFDSGCFSGEKYLFSGNPSDIISNKPVHDLRDDQKKDKPLLFITGGANGSFILNEFVLKNIDWINHNFEVFLQYGTNPINIERFEN